MAVIGYGWVGRGIATYVHAMGGRVVAVDTDPIKALEAHTDGHDVAGLLTALAGADLVITCTGGMRAIGVGHLEALKPSAVLANAGHHDLEIDVPALEAAAGAVDEPRPGVTRYDLAGKPVYLLSGGALVNIAGGLGHAIEIMDLSFSVQALGCHTLVTTPLAAGVHRFPDRLDRAIARARLASRGIHLDGEGPGPDDPLAELWGER